MSKGYHIHVCMHYVNTVATHIDSGTRYAVSKNLTVIRPTFVGYDSSVFTLPGVNITLRCIPNDTRAPVIWSK